MNIDTQNSLDIELEALNKSHDTSIVSKNSYMVKDPNLLKEIDRTLCFLKVRDKSVHYGNLYAIFMIAFWCYFAAIYAAYVYVYVAEDFYKIPYSELNEKMADVSAVT